MSRAKLGVGLFAATGIMSFIAALLPALKGEDANVTFLGAGVVFFVIAVAMVKKARADRNIPPAA
ncbi:MAG: hypothetical protein HY527_00500 [Betaproteobacteria bacterium]|nr:hypothetical protein [Betaproteobacteria bacterium]